MLTSLLNPSIENMKWDNKNPLFPQLVEWIEQYRAEIPLDVNASTSADRAKHMKKLRAIVRDNLGIRLEVTYVRSPGFGLHMMIPGLESKEFQRVVKEHGDKEKLDLSFSKANAKTGMLEGFISLIPCKLIIYHNLLVSDAFTPSEIAAAIAHELGHFWTSLELSGNLLRAGLSVQQAVDEYLNADTPDEKFYVLQNYNTSLTAKDINEVIALDEKNGNGDAAATVLISEASEAFKNNYTGRRSEYGARALEQQADDFVVRIGGGEALSSFMNRIKLRKDIDFIKDRTSNGVLAALSIIAAPFFSATPLVGGLLLGTALGIIVHEFLFRQDLQIRYSSRDHDSDMDRIQRILNQNIARLKALKADPEDRRTILEEIDRMMVISKAVKELTPMSARLITNVFPHLRSRHKFSTAMYQLETLMHNPLYITYAKLEGMKK